ncbi:lipoprotein [Rhodoferax sp. PAMC 29310]|uniref:LPS translocon maturation chaperone LptM n=1 Tax=Rhodoferax sp. PAMC 29310 TaxID=2822760 RepID=UPI001B32D554
MLNFQRILISVAAIGASAVFLTACGQQGALYLPTKNTDKPASDVKMDRSNPSIGPESRINGSSEQM